MRRRPIPVRGFTLPWVILTVAIVAALAAVVAPEVATIRDRQRMASVAARLRAIASGVASFRASVGSYPGRISELSNLITTSDRGSCHQSLTSTNVANWQSRGPFIEFWSDHRGVWTEIGRVNDSLPVRPSPAHTTPISADIPGVRGADAALLDAYVDGSTGDTVTYNAIVNDTTTVHYRLLSSSAVGVNHC